MDQVHVDVCSSDCVEFYPLNNGSDFRVGLGETLLLKGRQWHVALVGLTVVSTHDGTELRGKELYLCSNIVDYSLVGDKKVQLLRKLCLGTGIKTPWGGCMFAVDTVDSSCFYKRVQTQEIKYIRTFITDRRGEKLKELEKCTVGVALHFKVKN